MKVKLEGNELLKFHKDLYNQLVIIPKEREIIYREEIKANIRVGKPRFKDPKYKWSPELLKEVHDHLQNIWEFFERHSFWFDNTIIPLITFEKRRLSKKSIIFLLENDIWNTDEIYGDYLIEKSQEKISISYFRRNVKVREFKLSVMSNSEIQEWICNDAVKQVINQFTFLWSKLETEIIVCIEEKFHQVPKLMLTSDYLQDQLIKTKNFVNKWSEASLLSLGRIAEIWILLQLGKTSTLPYEDVIREIELFGKINKHEVKLLRKIRSYYNNVKHKPYFKIERDMVSSLIDEFSGLFLKLKKN